MDAWDPSAERRGMGTGRKGSDGKRRRKFRENSQEKVQGWAQPAHWKTTSTHSTFTTTSFMFQRPTSTQACSLQTCKPKIRVRHFWVWSPASRETKGLWGCRQRVRYPGTRTRPGYTEGRSLSPLWSKAVWARESEMPRNQPLPSGHLLGVLSPPSPTPPPSQEVRSGSCRRAPLVLRRPLAAVRSNAISQPFLLSPSPVLGMHSPWALASLILFLFSKEVPYRG